MGILDSSNAANGSHNGFSDPITAGPTEFDVVKTTETEKFLVDAGLFESQEEAIKRKSVLGKLDQVGKQRVKNVRHAKGVARNLWGEFERVAEESGMKRESGGSEPVAIRTLTRRRDEIEEMIFTLKKLSMKGKYRTSGINWYRGLPR